MITKLVVFLLFLPLLNVNSCRKAFSNAALSNGKNLLKTATSIMASNAKNFVAPIRTVALHAKPALKKSYGVIKITVSKTGQKILLINDKILRPIWSYMDRKVTSVFNLWNNHLKPTTNVGKLVFGLFSGATIFTIATIAGW